MTWKAVAAEGQEFYAIGRGDGFVMPLRAFWDGRNQTILVRPKQVAWSEWLWTLCPMVKKGVVVTMPAFEPALPFALPPNNLFSTKLEFRLPSWLNGDRLMAVATYSDVTYALYPNSLTAYDSNTGFVIATSALPPGPPPIPVQMIARSKHVYVTWNNAILIISLAGSTRIDPMPRPVRGLAASALHTRLRIVVAFDEGGRVLWEHGDVKAFGEGLFEPYVAFTRGGILVAADDHRGRIYSTEGGDLRQRGEFAGAGPSTIAITPTNRIDEFATFTSDGLVTVYKVPA